MGPGSPLAPNQTYPVTQERAFISGLEAANQLARSGALGRGRDGLEHEVLEIRDDEPQVCLYVCIYVSMHLCMYKSKRSKLV